MKGFPRSTVLCALLFSACGGDPTPIEGQRAYDHTAKLLELGPRPAGSKVLRQAADYFKAEVEKLGLTANEQTWTHTAEVYGESRSLQLRNLWTEIPGADPEHGPILLLAAHYDSKKCEGHPDPAHNFPFVGAMDSAASCGVLLEMARVLKTRKNLPNVWIAWFDGEESLEFEWDLNAPLGTTNLIGSTHFARAMAEDRQRFPNGLAARLKVLVLLDLLGDKNMKIDRDTRSNSDLLRIFAAAGSASDFPMFKYDSPMTDDHVPFQNLGIPVIDLIDFYYRTPSAHDDAYVQWWHTADDTLDHVSAPSLGKVGEILWRALPGIEAKFYAK